MLKILVILFVITILVLIWWKTTTRDIAYFDGKTIFQIPNPLFTKGQDDEISIALKLPKDGVRNGIVLFMSGTDNNFQIVYIQDGKLIINTNNDSIYIMIPDLETYVKSQFWLRLSFTIMDQFKSTPIYFGGAPIEQIPINTLSFDDQPIPFPNSGLMACTNYCYLNNDVNISTMFQQHGLRTYC